VLTGRDNDTMATASAPQGSAAAGADEVGGISEITILPDGRVYVLGLSAEILTVLEGVGPWVGGSVLTRWGPGCEASGEEAGGG
jgi:hypothetical protein